MATDPGLANLSDNLFVGAIGAYAVAMVGYTAQYAFGAKGAVAARSSAQPARTLATVGADAGRADGSAPMLPDEPAASGALAVAEPNSPTNSGLARWAGRVAAIATTVGALLQIGSLASRGFATDRVPWGNMYEFIAATCLFGVIAWLAAAATRPAIRHLGMFVILPVVLLLGLAGTVLYAEAAPLMPALNSYWLKIHVSAAAIASGIFLFGFVTGLLFLVRQRYEAKGGAANTPVDQPARAGLAARLPSSEALERLTFRVHALAFPLWTFAIIAGAIWAEAAWTRYWGWDPKETWAFISWVIYAAYLHARATAGWRGTKAVALVIAGWASMMVNLFVINLVTSGLHSYSGVN